MDIGKSVIVALRWSAAARLVGMVASAAMTILVIRLLTPADYGLLAMAVILPSALFLLNDLGLDVVLVQHRSPSDTLRRQVLGVVILVNLFWALVLVLGAPLVASFFNEPLLVPIIRALSLQFVLFIFDTLPRAKLEQRLDFRSQAVISVVSGCTGGIVSLILAWAGFGVWSLVWGRVSATAVSTTGLNLVAPSFHWPLFSIGAVKRSLAFGGFVTLERTAWQVFTDADKVIGGKLWSEVTLGLYTLAQDLATMPMHRTGGLINSIGAPAFSAVQDRLDHVRFYLLRAVRITSMLSVPIFIGLAVTAPDVVTLLLGPQWSGAAPILQILALVTPLRMVAMLLSPVLWGIARPSISATNVVIAAVVIPCSCLVGGQWGPLGMAVAWLASYPLVFLVTLHRSAKAVGLTVSDFGRAVLSPTLAGLVMAAIVLGVRWTLTNSDNLTTNLLALVAIGALTYFGVLILIGRSSIREAMLLVTR